MDCSANRAWILAYIDHSYSIYMDTFVVIILFVVLQRLFCSPKLMTASVHAIIFASLVYL